MAPASSIPRGGEVASSLSSADAVVVSYNTRRCLEQCLIALGLLPVRVIVVDSGSTDGTLDLARERFPSAEVVPLSANRGFGAAANTGIALGSTPYVVLLNADAWPRPGALATLVEVAERNPEVAILGPRLLNLDGSSQRSVFGYPAGPFRLATWASCPELVSGAFRTLRSVQEPFARARRKGNGNLSADCQILLGDDFPAGAALLIRRSALDDVGGFDEAFFMYSEETDLCRRLRERGWRVAFCPQAEFTHVGAASTAQSAEAMSREQLRSYLRFIAKHRGDDQADRARRFLAAALRVRSLASLRGDRARHRELASWISTGSLDTLLG